MPIDVQLLADKDEQEYTQFVSALPYSMVYGSLAYRDFLREALPGARDAYLVARDNEVIVGVLPTFVSAFGEAGALLNSLPFFGSHGGPMVAEKGGTQGSPADIERALIQAYIDLEEQYGVAASTLVESPFRPLGPAAIAQLAPSHRDARIGQFTDLPNDGGGSRAEVEDRVLAACHQKTRNAVRKALRMAPSFEEDASAVSLAWLHAEHERAIAELGGMVKPLPVLEALVAAFQPSNRLRLYRASIDGEPAAALLMLYHGKFVEYFMPVSTAKHRSTQILSALVFHAMVEATMSGYEIWNWGGTWSSQEGVYRFKSRWGARNLPYRYHVRVASKALLSMDPATLREQYPFFYAYPFTSHADTGDAMQ
jgi:Acetyltransferase (GNAT) domain